ncbi:hypothetical protein IJZ97_02620 [bacterium]|nr:hypothetical protein [bacterium]
MLNRVFLLSLAFLISINSVQALDLFNREKNKDAREKEAEYIHNVLKKEEAEKYGRKKFNYKPSGFMTVEEYEALSQYKDKSTQDIEIPKTVVKDSDMKYVPEPTYKIVRYNDPPGSPELNISKKFYKLRQYNGQGITSPDITFMVYPVVYYYPNSASTASDLFIIPLEESGTPLSKIMKANVVKRIQDPILSTEKSIDNDFAFRSLTPVDFSTDGKKLLVKEKIGSSHDGIWETHAIVYDFENKVSYNLVEIRDAIVYYWKENRGLNLDDSRWDIYPLGFLQDEPNRIAVAGYAYTGKKPIFLGMWSIDYKGEQSRLISFNTDSAKISVNGFKIIQDGVVKKAIVEQADLAQKELEELEAKAEIKRKEDFEKQIDKECKARMKEMDAEFRQRHKEYAKQNNIAGTTSLNDNPEKYRIIKINELKKQIAKEEKRLSKELKEIEKLNKQLLEK